MKDKYKEQINRIEKRENKCVYTKNENIISNNNKIFFKNFQSSSCLSDREEEDLYDFAAKYEGGRGLPFGRNYFSGQPKPKLSPSG